MRIVYGTFATPFGRGVVAIRDGALRMLRISSAVPPPEAVEDRRATAPILGKLERFFRGEAVEFDERLDVEVSPFAAKVMKVARRIPRGATWTYGRVAAEAGAPGAARAVGRVMGANPVALVVP
jgi:methylated-DNA-[protein]-cysteine S-methyltransferase